MNSERRRLVIAEGSPLHRTDEALQGVNANGSFLVRLRNNDDRVPAAISTRGSEFCHRVSRDLPGKRGKFKRAGLIGYFQQGDWDWR